MRKTAAGVQGPGGRPAFEAPARRTMADVSDTPNADQVEDELRRMCDEHRTWLGPVDPELREPSPDPQAIAWGELRRAWEELKQAVRDAWRSP